MGLILFICKKIAPVAPGHFSLYREISGTEDDMFFIYRNDLGCAVREVEISFQIILAFIEAKIVYYSIIGKSGLPRIADAVLEAVYFNVISFLTNDAVYCNKLINASSRRISV